MSTRFKDRKVKAPTQRQLQVGEEIRHALSSIFLRAETNDPRIDDASVTVSEVQLSPDLKSATAFVMPLAGRNVENVLAALNDQAGQMRHLVSSRVRLRYIPKINFRQDTTFDTAQRIGELLNNPRVAQDLKASD